MTPREQNTAAHELRLVFEALTALPPGGYAGGVPVAYTVEDLLRAFYRGGAASMYRSGDRLGDWAQIRQACQWIDHSAIPWRVPSGNVQSWFLMRLRTLPGERPASDGAARGVGEGAGRVMDRRCEPLPGALSTRQAADAAGVVILETEAVEKSGKRGWRVVPTAAAKAIRAAHEKGRKG